MSSSYVSKVEISQSCKMFILNSNIHFRNSIKRLLIQKTGYRKMYKFDFTRNHKKKTGSATLLESIFPVLFHFLTKTILTPSFLSSKLPMLIVDLQLFLGTFFHVNVFFQAVLGEWLRRFLTEVPPNCNGMAGISIKYYYKSIC